MRIKLFKQKNFFRMTTYLTVNHIPSMWGKKERIKSKIVNITWNFNYILEFVWKQERDSLRLICSWKTVPFNHLSFHHFSHSHCMTLGCLQSNSVPVHTNTLIHTCTAFAKYKLMDWHVDKVLLVITLTEPENSSITYNQR